MSHESLWESLHWFVGRLGPVLESLNVQLCFHPDDPCFDIEVDGIRLPRILTDHAAYNRLFDYSGTSKIGTCFCSGSLATNPGNDLVTMARSMSEQGRLHFVHLRNIVRLRENDFYESRHDVGVVPMALIVRALKETGFEGVVRPDHGTTLQESKCSHPGYCWETRAMGAYYIAGLWDSDEEE